MRTALNERTVVSKSPRWSRACLTLAMVAVALVAGTAPGTPAAAAESSRVVNINTASAEQLALLPRVGASVAQRIIEFREKNGRFETLEDLMLVRGIGEKTYELIEPHVTLTGDTTLTEKVRVDQDGSEGP